MKKWLSYILIFFVSNSYSEAFFKTHGLLLFFSSKCPHCQAFAPNIRDYAANHHAPLLALSFDNQGLPEIPDFIPVTPDWVMAAFQNKSIVYPALFIVNKYKHTLYQVSEGNMSLPELDARMRLLMAKVNHYERGMK